MIGLPPYECDAPGCSQTRTDTNHWFAIRVYSQGKTEIYVWERAEQDGVLADSKHFCGQTHALQFLSQVLGQKKEEL